MVAVMTVRRFSSGHTRIFGVFSSFDMTRKLVYVAPASIHSLAPPLAVETAAGNLSPLSVAQTRYARPICFKWLVQLKCAERRFARARRGSTTRTIATSASAIMTPSRTVKARQELLGIVVFTETSTVVPDGGVPWEAPKPARHDRR